MKNFLRKIFFIIKNHKNRIQIKKLQHLFADEEVLVVCSGPSAKNLHERNLSKYKILCCNFSFKFLPKNIEIIDLFITTEQALSEGGDIEEVFERYKIKNLIINSKKVLKNINSLNVENIFIYDPRDNFLVRNLLHADLEKIVGDSNVSNQNKHISSGAQLVQYALYGSASKIFISGLDMTGKIIYAKNASYREDPESKINRHLVADSFFIKKSEEMFPEKIKPYQVNL